MIVYSTEPPPDVSAPDVQGSEQHVWKLRPDVKLYTCEEGYYLQWSGLRGCGCTNNGGAYYCGFQSLTTSKFKTMNVSSILAFLIAPLI